MIRFAWCWGIIFLMDSSFTGMLLDAVKAAEGEDKAN